LNEPPQFKTGNAFVTESLPKYTTSCFFTACSGEKNNEAIANSSDTYTILSIFAFWVQSLETELAVNFAFSCVYSLFVKRIVLLNPLIKF
jgi:hypothetical protein